MREIKLTIGGQEVQLTGKQLEMLGIKKVRENPFKRVDRDESYFYIGPSGSIFHYSDRNDAIDKKLLESCNYFNDRNFAHQVALHQLLYRKLLKFAWDNEAEDIEWGGNNVHYCICYAYSCKCFYIEELYNGKSADVFFSKYAVAQKAINEVVEPFMKEHPDFVW